MPKKNKNEKYHQHSGEEYFREIETREKALDCQVIDMIFNIVTILPQFCSISAKVSIVWVYKQQKLRKISELNLKSIIKYEFEIQKICTPTKHEEPFQKSCDQKHEKCLLFTCKDNS